MAKQSGGRRKRTMCSFCGRSSGKDDTFIEGPDGVFICPECVDLCHNIILQNRKQIGRAAVSPKEMPIPRQIKEYLDQYVIATLMVGKHSLDAPNLPLNSTKRNKIISMIRMSLHYRPLHYTALD